ncbi:MAG: phenylalanine--tRNA ligase subunit beta [Tannerellaceae bacterium]|jgi:phenylalanyl-tRNA synthetase beta chain|nr:phenylalanine--tRNA ligase subunit beta [Tannerellaceae bacterium]
MILSYNWLRELLPSELSPQEIAAALTSLGLETDHIEEIQFIRGGLEGLVVAEVLTCEPHPNSDHLHVTRVHTGSEELQIVCGAPNVAAGQKVIVALTGTKLYQGDQSITIKRSKIRGVESQGMICAEDEIGVGGNHEGIIVLPPEVLPGTSAKQYYQLESDYALEADITPNRVDATSHFGVARDLSAFLKRNSIPAPLHKPSVAHFSIDDKNAPAIKVRVEDPQGCLRYSGLTLRGVKVSESPAWLQHRLKAIGLRPINNIVDVTNFVLHEAGQPLHAFDLNEIRGGEVIVRTVEEGTPFVTLDGVQRILSAQDLMICNAEEPMCIAGVFGGLGSGVTEKTTDIFLESATFDPIRVRKTARRLAINTDASFRYERGLDPNATLYALRRAALLIQELAGGKVTGEIEDIYPQKREPYSVSLSYAKINALTGQEIPRETVKEILDSLEIEVKEETPEGLLLHVPPYRIDVQRDVDVIEEILRIYGYNHIQAVNSLSSTLSYRTAADRSHDLQNLISEQLCGNGFHEIMNNSLCRAAYYEELVTYPAERCVMLKNPLSADLNAVRQTLLFGGLESIDHNLKRKNGNIRFFEFGHCAAVDTSSHKEEGVPAYAEMTAIKEELQLGLWLCGYKTINNWAHADEATSFYELKGYVEGILSRLGVKYRFVVCPANDIYSAWLDVVHPSGKSLGTLGVVSAKLCRMAGVEPEVYYAELKWASLMRETGKQKLTIYDVPRYPAVKRDLALLLDEPVAFADIEKIAYESERKLLKEVRLFDVYEGKNLPEGKKSYAVSFYLQDETRTLDDRQIEAVMGKIRHRLEEKLGAQLR